jgi:hypothetical protein
VDEPQGIYRGEVLAIMGALADIYGTPRAYCRYSERTVETTMNPKKWTPEQWRAWREARDARLRELHAHIERIKAELASGKSKPA